MGSTDSLPIVSQAKSGVQWISGDSEAAKKTQENFLDQCIGFSQGKSLYQLYKGDEEGAIETQRKYLKAASNAIDGIPVVGHMKGGIHYACKDKEGGNNAMKSASRSTGVLAGGFGGFLVGGPVGAVAGGIAGGATVDGITTGIESKIHGEFRPSGQIAAVNSMIKGEAKAGDYFDSVMGVAFDGLGGYAGGKLAAKFMDARATKLYRVMEAGEATEAVKSKKVARGYQQTSVKGETWVSESAQHSKEFLQQKQKGQPGVKFEAVEVKVNKGFIEQMKAENTIQQQGSAAHNTGVLKKNLYNTERLSSNPQGKVNIGIKGDANLNFFNENVIDIKKIDPTNYQNGQTSGGIKFGNGTPGVLVESGKESKGSASIRQAREVEPVPCL